MRLRMKNKVELKKYIVKSILIITLALIIFGVYQYCQYRIYTTNFNNKIGSIMTKIIQEYPNIDKNDLIKIVNSKESTNINLFKEYGIDLNKDSLILINDKFLKYSIIFGLLILFIVQCFLVVIFLKYNSNKDKKLKEITKYIEDINNRNYRLDIDDNTEDELSILKNEIYKTTIMLKEVAENSLKDKTNLKDSLSDISHQLKTPLTSITIMLDNILDNPYMKQETRIDFIKNIKKQIININFLIQSLLKLSKLDANAINFLNKDETLTSIVNQAIENVSILSELKNVKINISGDNEVKIYCDAKWQIEAITNILKNAIEHSKESSIIDVYFEENNMYSQIKIKDYGIGIDNDDLPHIFERFYKGKNSSNDSIGIGLALSKSIIEKNGGSIEVNSEVNKGTEFVIKYFKWKTK